MGPTTTSVTSTSTTASSTSTTTSPTSSSSTSASSTEYPDTTTSDVSGSTNSTQAGRADEVEAICYESDYAVFLPHPYDCSLYYECVGLTPVLMSCPPGLYFDYDTTYTKVCNWPEYVRCESSNPPQ